MYLFYLSISEVIGIFGLQFSFRKFQFDSKSNFVEESLRKIRLFGLHFSSRKFQFDSKSNFVEESLRRYKNFWPGSRSQFHTKSNFVEESLKWNRFWWPAFFHSESFNLIQWI